jgi:hypothetical protein
MREKVISLSAVTLFAFAITFAGCRKKEEPAPPPPPPASAPQPMPSTPPAGGVKPGETTPPPDKAPDRKDESKTK